MRKNFIDNNSDFRMKTTYMCVCLCTMTKVQKNIHQNSNSMHVWVATLNIILNFLLALCRIFPNLVIGLLWVICLKEKIHFLWDLYVFYLSWLLTFNISSRNLLASPAALLTVLRRVVVFCNSGFCSQMPSTARTFASSGARSATYLIRAPLCFVHFTIRTYSTCVNSNEAFFHVNCSVWKLTLISLLNSRRNIISLVENWLQYWS